MPPENNGTGSKIESDHNKSRTKTDQSSSADDFDSSFPSPPADTNIAGPNQYSDNNLGALDDAKAVFRASLEFQNQAPPPGDLLERTTSSSSLYPSREFVSRQVGQEIELDQSWHDCASPYASMDDNEKCSGIDDGPKESKREARNYRIMRENKKMQKTKIAPSSLAASPASSPATTARASLPRRNDEDEEMIAMKLAAYGGDHSFSSQATHHTHAAVGVGTPTAAQTASADHHAAAVVIEESVHPSDIETNAVQAEFVSTSDAGTLHVDDNQQSASTEMVNSGNSIGAVHAVPAAHAETMHATMIQSFPMQIATLDTWTASCEAEATVLQGENVGAGDADRKPPAVDHSAPFAYNHALPGNLSPQIQSFPSSAGQQAEAAVIDCDVHPSNVTAEAPVERNNLQPYVDTRQRSQGLNALYTQNAQATVIDYDVSPSDISVPDAVHATLRLDARGAHQDPEARIVDYEAHPSPPVPQEDLQLELQGSNHVVHNFDHSQEAHATVVECDVHPSELSYNAVQAELVGEDFSAQLHNEVAAQPSSSHISDGAHAIEVEGSNMEEATEATVIESGPMHKATREAWSAEPASEAQVMEGAVGEQSGFTGKPPMADDMEGTNCAPTDDEAEVVDVAEEAHPSEFPDDAAQAELIGSDYGRAIAVPRDQGIVEEAAVVIEGPSTPFEPSAAQVHAADSEALEAQATLIDDDHLNGLNESTTSHQTHPVTAVIDESYVARDSGALDQPVTPVTVMEASFENPSRPPKADPLVDRSSSEPTVSVTGNASGEVQPETRSYSSRFPTSPTVHETAISEEFSTVPPIPPPVPAVSSISVTSTASRTSRASHRSESSSVNVGLQSVSFFFHFEVACIAELTLESTQSHHRTSVGEQLKCFLETADPRVADTLLSALILNLWLGQFYLGRFSLPQLFFLKQRIPG